MAGLQRREVDRHASLRVLRGEDVVEQRPLVEVHRLRRWLPREDVARELEHVVGVARLGGGGAEVLGGFLDGMEMLAVAVATNAIGTVQRHALPEELRHITELLLARQLILARRAGDLGNLRVSVETVELVLTARQRVEAELVVERQRQLEVIGVAGNGVKVGERLIDAAMLVAERLLLLLMAELRDTQLQPVGHLHDNVERLLVAAVVVHVKQTGENLVERIVRRPDRLAGVHAIEKRLRIGRQKAFVISLFRHRFLALRQLRDDVVHLRLELRVAGAGKHQRARRQIMPHAVAAQFALRIFPATIRLGCSRQSGHDAERMQQPVGVEVEQILLVAQHRLTERPVEQSHFGEVERLEFAHAFRRDGIAGGQRERHNWRNQNAEQRESEQFHVGSPVEH